MATTINIMSFEDAAIYSCLKNIPPTIIISVDDQGFPITPLDIDNPAIIGVLKLWFQDSTDPRTGMTAEDAERVVAFVRQHSHEAPDILVHCAAGISRSAGIAAALDRWLNGDDSRILESPHRRPNFLCYERVLDAAGVEHDPEEDRLRFDVQRKIAKAYNQNVDYLEGCWDDDYEDEGSDATISSPEDDVAVADTRNLPPTITADEIAAMTGQWDAMMERVAGYGSFHAATKLGEYLERAIASSVNSLGEEEDEEWDYSGS